MKSQRFIEAACLMLAALAPPLAAQPPAGDLQRGLGALKKLVTGKNLRGFGFDSLDQLTQVTLDVPLRRYFVTAGELLSFKDGDNPDTLFHSGGEWLYPVVAVGKTRCIITMADRGKGWQAVAIGDKGRALALTAARTAQSTERRIPPASFFAVEIAPLSLYLLGWQTDGAPPADRIQGQVLLFPTPARNRSMTGPSSPQPAASLFPLLREEVRKQRVGAPAED